MAVLFPLRLFLGVGLLVLMQLTAAHAQITTPQNANGSSIILNQPVDITTTATGTTGYNLWAQNSGTISSTTNSIVLSSQNSSAIVAQSGGQITLDGTGGTFTISTANTNTNGAVFVTGASSVNLTGATVTASTASLVTFYGARAMSGGQLTLTNSTLNLTGNPLASSGTGPVAISIEGSGTSSILNNMNVNVSTSTNGQSLVGIQAINGATMTGDTINIGITSGGGTGSKVGLKSDGANTQVTLSNVTITGNAINTGSQIVTGAQALSGGHLTINGGTISGAGIVTGLSSNITGSLLVANNVSVSSSRASSLTLVTAANGGTLTMNGGSIVTNTASGSIAVQSLVANSIVNLTNTAVTLSFGSTGATGGYALDAYGPSTINASGAIINATSGSATSRAIGATFEQSGGRINVTNGSSITVTGGTASTLASYGVLVNGTNNIFTGSDSSITTNRFSPTGGMGVTAIQAQNGGTALLVNMTITANGTGSIGAAAVGAGSQITTSAGTSITTTGTTGYGFAVQNGAIILATDSVVQTQGAGANALLLSGAGSTNTATITNTTLSSIGAAAISALTGTANVSLLGAAATVTGNGVWLDVASAATANVTVGNGATINGSATTASGGVSNVALNSGAVWNIAGNSSLTSLAFDAGILRYTGVATLVSANPLQLNAGGGTIDTNGFDALLSQSINGSGKLTKTGSGVLTLSADEAYTGGTTISGGTLKLGNGGASGSVVGDILNNAALAFNRSDIYTYTGVISGSGSLEQIGPGTLILTNIHTFTGPITVTSGQLAVGDETHPGAALTGGGLVTVSAGAIFGGYGSVTGNVINNGTLAIGAAIDALAGGGLANFRIIGDLTNNELIQIGNDNAVGNRLTIIGNYVAHSSMAMNTVLNGDGSPSDLFVISGAGHTASGITGITIKNVGGLGSFTDGNGIAVVSATGGATTQTSAFFLSSPVVAGPYEYSLYRGARDGSDLNGWYLRNDNPNPPAPPTPPSPPSPPSPPTPPLIPDYRQEVSLYLTVQSQAQIYGRELLGSLHERSGDISESSVAPTYEERQVACGTPLQKRTCTVRVPVVAGGAKTWFPGGWGRVIGEHGSFSNGGGLYTHGGAAFDYDIYALQAGFDLMRHESANGSVDKTGIYVAIGQIDSDVTHFNGARVGRNTIDAYSVGAYWTHFDTAGWYIDAVVQATRYEDDSRSSRGFRMKTDGYGLAASFEGGYALQLGQGFVVEPQAQLVYQHVSFDDSSDSGASVYFKDANSLAGRIGVRLKKDWVLDNVSKPHVLTTWLRANIWHEFMGDNKMSFSSLDGPVNFTSDLGGSWAEIQAGVRSHVTDAVSVFASGGYQVGFTGDRHAYSGKLGLRIDW